MLVFFDVSRLLDVIFDAPIRDYAVIDERSMVSIIHRTSIAF